MIDLVAGKFRLTLTVLEPMVLPAYKGSTFRGGFGSVFRKICCSQRQLATCDGCLLATACPYWNIFEPGVVGDSEIYAKFSEIPRPFIIEPPETTKQNFDPGDKLEFNLILVGKALECLPYFILVYKELGAIGMGKDRARFRLDKVESLYSTGEREPLLIYDGERVYSQIHRVENPDLINGRNPFTRNEGKKRSANYSESKLTIEFLTMTRLKQAGEFVECPAFSVLIRALLRRLSALQYFYCDRKMEEDYQTLVSLAEEVKLIKDNTAWVDWERFSSRQHTRMKLGGLVGTAEYEGCPEIFRDYLRWGELLHVGKGATFGLGKYKITKY